MPWKKKERSNKTQERRTINKASKNQATGKEDAFKAQLRNCCEEPPLLPATSAPPVQNPPYLLDLLGTQSRHPDHPDCSFVLQEQKYLINVANL
jgi:hypothetical protein